MGLCVLISANIGAACSAAAGSPTLPPVASPGPHPQTPCSGLLYRPGLPDWARTRAQVRTRGMGRRAGRADRIPSRPHPTLRIGSTLTYDTDPLWPLHGAPWAGLASSSSRSEALGLSCRVALRGAALPVCHDAADSHYMRRRVVCYRGCLAGLPSDELLILPSRIKRAPTYGHRLLAHAGNTRDILQHMGGGPRQCSSQATCRAGATRRETERAIRTGR